MQLVCLKGKFAVGACCRAKVEVIKVAMVIENG